MAAKTDKDVTEDAAEGGAPEAADTPAGQAGEVEASGADTVVDETGGTGEGAGVGEAAAKPAKRRRRVRVIEVLDDDDLDEVLEAIDAEDDEAADEPAAAPAAAKAAKAAKTVETAKPAAKPAKPAKPARPAVEPAETAVDDTDDAEGKGGDGKRRGLAKGTSGPSGPVIAVIVVVALLLSLAIWQWRSASTEGGKADARAEVGKVASAYGDVALTYDASNYKGQMDKAQKLMGGDLLDSYKTTTLPGLGETFKNSPQLSLSSKTDQVFVGSVDGKFATAVVLVDIKVQSDKGNTEAPATLLRLVLAKIGDSWKVTKQYASGVNDKNQQQAGGQLPNVPGGGGAGTTPSAKPEESKKPKD